MICIKNKEEVEKNVNRAMKEINITDLKDRPCHHLSYGQKKRVSIAAITAMEPELLILDEPTAWLDSKNTKRVLGGIRGAAQLLEADAETDAVREYTGVIIQEVDRLQQLVDRLLAPGSGRRAVARINIHEVCEQVRRLVQAEYAEGLVIERDYDASLPELEADRA